MLVVKEEMPERNGPFFFAPEKMELQFFSSSLTLYLPPFLPLCLSLALSLNRVSHVCLPRVPALTDFHDLSQAASSLPLNTTNNTFENTGSIIIANNSSN